MILVLTLSSYKQTTIKASLKLNVYQKLDKIVQNNNTSSNRYISLSAHTVIRAECPLRSAPKAVIQCRAYAMRSPLL